jgi:transposase
VTKSTLRVFDTSVKPQVVEKIRDQCVSISQACRDMKLGEAAVSHRLAQVDTAKLGQSGIGKPLTAEQLRIIQLEIENRQLL